MGKLKAMNDAEIRAAGILVLNKALGSTAALRFLTLLSHEQTDYVEISRKLYEGQSVDEIFERAQEGWKK